MRARALRSHCARAYRSHGLRLLDLQQDRLFAPDRARQSVKLVSGADALTTYTWNTRTAKHHFCSVCGVKSFYVPRSHPDGYSVNARCLDEGTIEDMAIVRKDGKNWEKTYGRD